MDKITYQIWLKAIPLENTNVNKKSDVLFSSNFGRKSLFKIFEIIKSEFIGFPLHNEDLSAIRRIFDIFNDFSSPEIIENELNKFMKQLRDFDLLINKIKKIFVSLRKEKIQLWEKIIDEYIENKDKFNEELKRLWIERKVRLGDF